MIFKRAVAKLRAQDWTAISIELAIVVVGVFIGTWVANWNQQQAEKARTHRAIVQMKPVLDRLTAYFHSSRNYYATTRAYAATAIAGWRRDPRISDRDFVIGAYQASQIDALNVNGATFSSILGADELRNIDDPTLRADVATLMSADYTQIDLPTIDTPYRRNVRRVIPVEIQDAIRARCGDRGLPNDPTTIVLPRTCDAQIDPAQAAKAAAQLRAHPELLEDLQFHVSAMDTLIGNVTAFEPTVKRIEAKRQQLG